MAALSVDGAPGSPMHQQLLSPVARALALLQHPPRHTCSHTLALRRYSLKEHTALSLKLLLVLRVQVRSEAIAPILGGDNASSVLQIRPGAACFATSCGAGCAVGLRPTEAWVDGAGCRRFVRAPTPSNGCSF